MYVSPYSDGVLLNVWIQPRASRTMIIGVYGDSIKIAVKSPPVGGKANEECISLLSDVLGLPKRQLTIKSGHQGRHKGIFIQGATAEEVVSLLEKAIKKG